MSGKIPWETWTRPLVGYKICWYNDKILWIEELECILGSTHLKTKRDSLNMPLDVEVSTPANDPQTCYLQTSFWDMIYFLVLSFGQVTLDGQPDRKRCIWAHRAYMHRCAQKQNMVMWNIFFAQRTKLLIILILYWELFGWTHFIVLDQYRGQLKT